MRDLSSTSGSVVWWTNGDLYLHHDTISVSDPQGSPCYYASSGDGLGNIQPDVWITGSLWVKGNSAHAIAPANPVLYTNGIASPGRVWMED